MTNDKKKSDKQDQTVTPRSLADSVADDSLARETIGDETISAGDAIDETLSAGPQPDATAAPPPGVEAISLEEAGLRHEREPRKEGGESGAGRAAGVLLIVFLTLVAAGAGAALGPLIHRTPAQTVDLSGLESRLSDLEGKVADTTGLTDKIAALGQEADALKERIAALEATPVATTDGNVATLDVSELTQRIGALEHGVSALASRVDGAIDQKLQAIDGRIASLEGGGASGNTGDDDAGGATNDSGSSTGGADTAATGEGAWTAQVASLRSSLAALSEKIDSLSGETAEITDLKSQLGDLASKLSTLSAATADLDTLRSDVATLYERASDPRAAFALAVGQLREDVLAGGSYAETLTTADALAPDDADSKAALATLRTWENDGVATRARLADALNAAAYRAVEESRRDTAEGWFDKTVAELASIVSIRRVDGESGGSTADDVTARAEARLRQDDLNGAIDEMASLTGAAAEAAAGWLDMARARQAAEQAVDTLSARAIALVGGAAG
jgi:hypothetical protein